MSIQADHQQAKNIRARKQQGFIRQLVASGASAADIRTKHASYVQQDAARETRFGNLRQAILSGLGMA
jgi:hypothetical protein